MLAKQTIKRKVYQTVEKLPPGSFEELSSFLDFLAFKYRVADAKPIVVLGGLWKDAPFDVTDEDVRALRQDVTSWSVSDDNSAITG